MAVSPSIHVTRCSQSASAISNVSIIQRSRVADVVDPRKKPFPLTRSSATWRRCIPPGLRTVPVRLVAQRVTEQNARDRDDRDHAAAGVPDDFLQWHRSDPDFNVGHSSPLLVPRPEES